MALTADSAHHEQQTRLRCALHAVNALINAAPYFTASEFDAFAADIDAREAAMGIRSFFSPHKLTLLGNWSLEVILAALQARSLTAVHYPSKGAGAPDGPEIVGFLLNRVSTGVTRIFGGRHWLALRRLNTGWFDFDSNLPTPRCIGSTSEVLALLLKEPESTHVLCVSKLGGLGAS